MRIKLNSIFVDDQSKALSFYTEILGFVAEPGYPGRGVSLVNSTFA